MKRAFQLIITAAAFSLLIGLFWYTQMYWGQAQAVGENRLSHFYRSYYLLSDIWDVEAFPLLMVNLLPFLGFCLLTYQDVSAYFGKMGVLSFTRQLKRSRWYLKRVASLYGSAFLYWTVYLIVGVFVILYLHEPPVMELDVLAYCIVDGLLTFVLFSCFLSLLVNLLSIRLGSAQSLVAVTVGVAVLSFALGFVFDGYLTDLYIQYPQLNSGMIDSTKYVQLPLWLTIFLYLNPMSHVLMNFHNPPSYFIFLSQNVPALQGESNHLPSWWGSLLILLLLNALAVGMGWMYLRKKDITPIEGK